MDCSPPSSSVCGILQAGILEWVAIPFSWDLPDPGIESESPALWADSLLSEPPATSEPSVVVVVVWLLSLVQLLGPQTVACQGPLSMEPSGSRSTPTSRFILTELLLIKWKAEFRSLLPGFGMGDQLLGHPSCICCSKLKETSGKSYWVGMHQTWKSCLFLGELCVCVCVCICVCLCVLSLNLMWIATYSGFPHSVLLFGKSKVLWFNSRKTQFMFWGIWFYQSG